MGFASIRAGVIGEGVALETAFGERPLVYADYTASGRAYAPIEEFIAQRVLPYYANTHSESSLTGRQTSRLREQARDIIRTAINASADDAIIFCGSGATAAINRLIELLNLRLPADLDRRCDLAQHIPEEERPVVFIGPYEHHSNELPWRESIAQLEVVPLTADGEFDLAALEAALLEYSDGRPIFGSFSAASNVTGLKTDTRAVSELMHRYGGRVFWDYAAAAPYMGIDVADKDAVFISPHKFLGGPGTPGLLVVKRDLLKNTVPAQPGGGTVSFVAPDFHRYLEDSEHREEGGTPGIIEAVRAGLVFKLQQEVGTGRIEAREEALVSQVLPRWSAHPNIRLLGNLQAPRLSIVSLQINRGARQLHYAFVVALLNDLFGIQARGGCSCAGPYGHSLLHISAADSAALDREVSRGNSVLRPGWVRLNFNYFLDSETVEYLLRAVELIADHGWKLLPAYEYERATGTWIYRGRPAPLPVCLSECELSGGSSAQATPALTTRPLAEYLEQAQTLVQSTSAQSTFTSSKACGLELDAQAEGLRWFYLPGDEREIVPCGLAS
jgi:selenocysteine lyase/cysteine desulfurase